MTVNDVVISEKQAELLEEWLEANSKVSGWLDSYPLGSSYIDTRANHGENIISRRAYVQLDHDGAAAVPELKGKSANTIRTIMNVRNEQSVPDVDTQTTFGRRP